MQRVVSVDQITPARRYWACRRFHEPLEQRTLLSATLTVTLAVNDDGTGNVSAGKFAVYADVSSAGGLALFQVDVANAKTIQNASPETTFRDSAGSDTSSAGFTLFRSTSASSGDLLAVGSQNTIDNTATLIYGLGQSAGSFAGQNPFAGGSQIGTVQNSWNAHLLLATGTYSTMPQLGSQQLGNVFISSGKSATETAAIVKKTITLGSSATGSVSGTVFNDANKDGAFDAGDSALSARKVFIDANNNGKLDSGEKSVTTNASGVYAFTGLAAGTYVIRRADTPAGYTITEPVGGAYTIALSAGQNVSGKDIGAVQGTVSTNSASISGTVFNDANKNGKFDAGDTALSARKMYIDANKNGKLDTGEKTATSNASGVYTFSGLAAGTYEIRRADTPAGYSFTEPASGFYDVTVAAAQVVTGKDFGAVLGTVSTNSASISGTVFNDGNDNGKRDSGESLLASRKIYIDANKNGKFDTGEVSVLTNASGVYMFSGLAAGTYEIRRADTPAGYKITDPASGFYDITVVAGQILTGKDIGAFA